MSEMRHIEPTRNIMEKIDFELFLLLLFFSGIV
jgi:hypothetical protein